MGSRRSPITGESFAPLSKEYKQKKADLGLSPVPDLEQSGDMLDSLDYQVTSKGIKLGVFGDAALRADGHNNLSGESALPERRFLPAEGESFISSIETEVNRIIADQVASGEDINEAELSNITSSSSLYEYLLPIFGLESRSETRLAVLRSTKWYETLSALGLIRWL